MEGDLAQLGHDLLVRPALEWPPQVDAYEFAEHASVDALRVIGLDRHDGGPFIGFDP
jgi:hypothetical protein